MYFHLEIGGKWITSQSKDGICLFCFPKISAVLVGRDGGNMDSQDTAAPTAVPVRMNITISECGFLVRSKRHSLLSSHVRKTRAIPRAKCES
jgi:hypothetical protein